jgi:signal transduction histidine kinase
MSSKSIRFRITAIAAIALAVVLLIAAAVLVVLQRSSLVSNLDQTLTRRADDIESLVSTRDTPRVFAGGREEGFVQLIGEDGAAIASTPNLEGEPPLLIEHEPGRDTFQVLMVPQVDDDVFRVLSRTVGDGVLHVATTFDVVSESTTALVGSLAVTIPIVVLILGGLVWWLVGRTLRPVEDIRAEVASIGSAHLDRRVSHPGTEDEIELLAETMNEMLDRLETSVERQQRFVADASHELRSPLTRLRTALELDIQSAHDTAERDHLRSLLAEVLEMQRMIEDLLYLARVDAEEPSFRMMEIDLDDLVLDEIRRLHSETALVVDSSRVSGAHVRGDRAQLSRAVKNVLDNAARHAEALVTIGLSEVDGHALLTIADDGPGIPHSATDRIFERFGRLDQARTKATGGTGLGLAIARDIVMRHDGSLVLANPGQAGATFEMRIPTAS